MLTEIPVPIKNPEIVFYGEGDEKISLKSLIKALRNIDPEYFDELVKEEQDG